MNTELKVTTTQTSLIEVRTMEKHLEEINSFFIDRMNECNLTQRLQEIKTVPQALEILKENSLLKDERTDIISSIGMALSDATEGFLFEYLLSTGYYKSEDDFYQEGEILYRLIEDEGELYIDMRLKTEMTIYMQLYARHFSDQEFAEEEYHSMLEQFDKVRKEKVALQFCLLRDQLQNDITGLEIQWEICETTDQLDEIRKERYESQLYVLRNVHKTLDEMIKSYYAVQS